MTLINCHQSVKRWRIQISRESILDPESHLWWTASWMFHLIFSCCKKCTIRLSCKFIRLPQSSKESICSTDQIIRTDPTEQDPIRIRQDIRLKKLRHGSKTSPRLISIKTRLDVWQRFSDAQLKKLRFLGDNWYIGYLIAL